MIIYRKEVIDHRRTGRAMRRFRIKHGISQVTLGQAIQRTKMQMHRLETGYAQWTEELVARTCRAITKLAS